MITKISHGDLEVTIDRSGECVRLEFIGICDFRNPEEIVTPIFEDLLVEHFREFQLSFARLTYMNSAMMPPIVQFMRQLEARNSQGVIVFDKNQDWQKKAFGLLGEFVKSQNLRRVVVRPEP